MKAKDILNKHGLDYFEIVDPEAYVEVTQNLWSHRIGSGCDTATVDNYRIDVAPFFACADVRNAHPLFDKADFPADDEVVASIVINVRTNSRLLRAGYRLR